MSVVGGGDEEKGVLEWRVCEAWRKTVRGEQTLYLSWAAGRHETRAARRDFRAWTERVVRVDGAMDEP